MNTKEKDFVEAIEKIAAEAGVETNMPVFSLMLKEGFTALIPTSMAGVLSMVQRNDGVLVFLLTASSEVADHLSKSPCCSIKRLGRMSDFDLDIITAWSVLTIGGIELDETFADES